MKKFFNQTMTFAFCLLPGLCLTNIYVRGESNTSFGVQTKVANGVIEGLYDTKSGLQMYFGIPYAKPPVGELRWKAPQPLDNWLEVKETKKFGPRAVQAVVFGDMNSRSAGISEDCLYLNIWTPAKRNTTNLPVLLYFYGGGFAAGDGSEPRYDGANMSKKGIVVVTINYRLNIFGFFAHPELSAEAPYNASGNYGLLDQNAALKWVNKNIVAFGGDPGKVTIAGESAGSVSVSAHMASPLSKGLFSGAICESGAAVNPTLSPMSLKEAEKVGSEFAKRNGDLNLQQLRLMSTRDIYEIYTESKRSEFPVVIDGYFFQNRPVETFNARKQAQVPLLLGWNSAEIPGTSFMLGLSYSEENYLKIVRATFTNDYKEVLKLYPYGSKTEIEHSATALASDRFIAYGTWKWFDLHRKYSSQPVYRYLYSKLHPALLDKNLTLGLIGDMKDKEPNTPKIPEAIGAPHACEIDYCMGNLDLNRDYAWTKDDYKVSDIMLNFFANFIKSSNPNGPGLPEWPATDAREAKPAVMIIDVDSKAVKSENEARYLFLDTLYNNN